MPIPCEMVQIRHSDHYQAAGRLWLPEKPRGGVLYLHGIQSHGAWFETSAGRLAEAGMAVLLPDRRGSGRNEHQRGHAPSVRRLLRDLGECLDELHVRTGFERFQLVGVSWGGKLALAMRRFDPVRISGLTLVAPGLFPKVDIPVSAKVRVALSVLAGGRQTFPVPLNEPALFTDNPARRRYIQNDPLRLMQVTARFLLVSRQLDRYVARTASDPAGCPLMLFLGGRDRIIDNEATLRFVRNLPWPERRITEYPEACHTLEFEPDNQVFMADLVSWVLANANG